MSCRSLSLLVLGLVSVAIASCGGPVAGPSGSDRTAPGVQAVSEPETQTEALGTAAAQTADDIQPANVSEAVELLDAEQVLRAGLQRAAAEEKLALLHIGGPG